MLMSGSIIGTCSRDTTCGSILDILLNLIQFKYDDYLNVMYRVDVFEKDLAKLNVNF